MKPTPEADRQAVAEIRAYLAALPGRYLSARLFMDLIREEWQQRRGIEPRTDTGTNAVLEK